MREHPFGSLLRWGAVATSWVAVCLVSAAAPAAAAEHRYVREDVEIRGEKLQTLTEAGQPVTVITGDFQLTLGPRVLRGRDAVLWTHQTGTGAAAQWEITVYVEGRAEMLDNGGTSLSDRTMLVALQHQGRMNAAARHVKGPLTDRSLYERAAAARKGAAERPVERPTPHGAPKLVVGGGRPRRPGAMAREDMPTPADGCGHGTRPVVLAAADRTRAPSRIAGSALASRPSSQPGKKPPPKRELPPVSGHADKLTYVMDPEKLKEWYKKAGMEYPGEGTGVILARGRVYMSQGHHDSDEFLELRCDAAVIFTREKPKGTAGMTPSSGPDSLAGTSLTGKKREILAAYLEGDVVIGIGNRTLRGPRAYYDFTVDRAIVVDGVFRTVQKQRDFPVFIRSDEIRRLSKREFWFRRARVTTSDFYSPTYHIAASRVYLRDAATYDKKGKRITPEKWEARLWHSTMNVGSVPISYWPYMKDDFEVSHTALRKVQIGDQGNKFGWGVETEWNLFRLLGVDKPRGFNGRYELSYYERGLLSGVNVKYARRKWSGYTMAYGLVDNRDRDEFGDRREPINVPNYRGRFTHRHKQFLPDGWQVQGEFSWYSDRGFPETFFPAEFHAGKPQETLLYGKHQQDNRVFTVLGQYRLNRFDTQTESAPDLGFHTIGEPLLGDRISLFSETHAGLKRWRPAKASKRPGRTDSRLFPRADTRQELRVPLHFGPVHVTPYGVVRGSYWDDPSPGGEQERPYGQIGAQAAVNVWRVYGGVESNLLDVHGLKHVITPEAAVFGSDVGGVTADDLWLMDPDIEMHLTRQSGYAVAIRQRLMTKRGLPGRRQAVDWMRLDVVAGRFKEPDKPTASDGRFFADRPEYGLARNHVNGEYQWRISNSTTLLSDANYSTHTGRIGRSSVGLNVARSPRMTYFGGIRAIRDLDSSVATLGFDYQATRKWSMSFFEQYDLDFRSGDNLRTVLGIQRALARWRLGLTVEFDVGGEGDDVAVYLTLWPQGVPEAKFGSGARGFMGGSNLN